MNGLEAFKKLRQYLNRWHRKIVNVDGVVETVEGYPLDKIERDLKVNQILKEKKIDLFGLNLQMQLHKDWTIDQIVEYHNYGIPTTLYVTQKEMQLIIDWLKEE